MSSPMPPTLPSGMATPVAGDVPNPALALPERYNAAAAFVDAPLSMGWGTRVALRTDGGSVTYAQLAEQANRAGNGLRALGLEMEQRVGVLLFDSPAFAATFFGAIKIGAVPVPLNTQLRPQDYLYMLNDSRARILVVEAALWPQLAPVRRELSYLRHVVLVNRDSSADAALAQGTLSYEGLLAGSSDALDPAPTTRDDAALWLYSSGSTGFPKGCVHLQHDMHVCAELYAKPILSLTEHDITFSAAKLFFAYGLGNGLYFPLAAGASSVHFAGRVTPEAAFQVIQAQRPTVFFGVPTLYAGMLALPDAAARFDTSSLRLCVSAGEALPADLYQRWRERFGVDILDGIGSTEILHIFISNQAGAVRPGSSGRIVPGYQAMITDEQGLPVPTGEIGNLLIAGDSICAQYWNKHERTRSTIMGAWIATGDKYFQDGDEYYWYAGRSDDMLKVSGQWVSPVEVEAALSAHPAVLEAAVIGRQDADGLVKPQAYVVLQQGETPSDALAETLQQYVKTTLVPYKYPRWIVFVLELPKTATGKIQRYILRQIVAEQAAPTAQNGESD
ncbi:MAG TPA: benzoate-CoA ligase family protein [Ktedonobacterales bacterium]